MPCMKLILFFNDFSLLWYKSLRILRAWRWNSLNFVNCCSPIIILEVFVVHWYCGSLNRLENFTSILHNFPATIKRKQQQKNRMHAWSQKFTKLMVTNPSSQTHPIRDSLGSPRLCHMNFCHYLPNKKPKNLFFWIPFFSLFILLIVSLSLFSLYLKCFFYFQLLGRVRCPSLHVVPALWIFYYSYSGPPS